MVEVAAGTDKLHITAPAKTQADTTLKFDNGSGTYAAGENFTYTLNLESYKDNKDYEREDGSLVIPFALDYDGAGSGVDGYYTLTVSFEEGAVDYTPVFTSVPEDAEVNIGDDLTLSVEVKPLDSDTASSLSYQWYSSDSAGSEGDAIPDATAATYDPPTDSAGITYYTCKATRTADSEKYSETAGPVKVTVQNAGEDVDLKGYVSDIEFWSSATETTNVKYFDEFEQNTTAYDDIKVAAVSVLGTTEE